MVNEQAVKVSLQELLREKQARLCEGLTRWGEPVELHQITRTNMSPPSGYVYVVIFTPTVRLEDEPSSGRTVAVPQLMRPEYDCTITIVDPAVPDGGIDDEDEPYEHSHDVMDMLALRTASLIRGQHFYGTTYKTELRRPERQVVVRDLSGSVLDLETQSYVPLAKQLLFTVVGRCFSDDALYT